MTEPMTDERLAAIEERAARVYPEEGGWNGTEAEDALPVVTEDVPALVAEVRWLTRELGQQRVLAAMHEHEADVARRRLDEARTEYERTLRMYAEGPSVADQLVVVSQSALDMERVADEAMTAGLAECERLRAEADALLGTLDATQLMLDESCKLRSAAETECRRLRAELDASRARELTLDAIALRDALPTPAEVRTVARGGDVAQVLCVHDGPTGRWYTVAAIVAHRTHIEPRSYADGERLHGATGCILLAPEGPVPWAWLKPPAPRAAAYVGGLSPLPTERALDVSPHGVAVAEGLAAPFAAESLGWDADGAPVSSETSNGGA